MNLSLISLEQVAIMFIMIMLGYILVKTKLVNPDSKKSLSNILVYVVVPCMIINSFIATYDDSILENLLWSFLVSFILLVLGIVISFIICIKYKTSDKPILLFALMFSNASYMGIPLIQALFGDIGVIYASGFLTLFNVLLWTVGYMVVSKTFNIKSTLISILKTPIIYSLIIGLLIFIFQIPIPNIIKTPLSLLGNMNTPLSMLVTGMIIGSSNIFNVMKNKYVWLNVGFRLLLIPLVCLGVTYLLSFFPISKDVLKIAFILMATPSAAITSIFAIKFNYNEDVAAGVVIISTILSIITLPLFTLAIDSLI
jgi:malate permease and related proteins